MCFRELVVGLALTIAAVTCAASQTLPRPVVEHRAREPFTLMAVNPQSNLEQELYSRSFAILIGESDYKIYPALTNTPAELSRLANTLKDHNFDVRLYLDLTGAQIRQVMDRFVSDFGLEKNARAVVYFAGHGETRTDGLDTDPMADNPDTRKIGYFVPVDAPKLSEGEAAFIASTIRFSEIVEWTEALEAKHVLTILDSCFSGALLEGTRSLQDKKTVYPKHAVFQKPVQSRVRHYITSGAANQPVPAVSSLNETFVKALKGELGGERADFNNDGFVTGRELFNVIEPRALAEADITPRQGWSRTQGMRDGDIVFKVAALTISSEPVATEQNAGQTTVGFDDGCRNACTEDQGTEKNISLTIPAGNAPAGPRLECSGSDGLTVKVVSSPKLSADGKSLQASFKAWGGSGECRLRSGWIAVPNACCPDVASGPVTDRPSTMSVDGPDRPGPYLDVKSFRVEGLGNKADEVFDIRRELEVDATDARRLARVKLAKIVSKLSATDTKNLVSALPNSSYRVALGVTVALSMQSKWTSSSPSESRKSLEVLQRLMNNDRTLKTAVDKALAKMG